MFENVCLTHTLCSSAPAIRLQDMIGKIFPDKLAQKCCLWSSLDNQKEPEIAKRKLVHVWQNLHRNAIPDSSLIEEQAKVGLGRVILNVKCGAGGGGGGTKIAERLQILS